MIGDEPCKVVTTLFADVAGSTAVGDRLDPETLRRVMSRHFDETRRIVEEHGGVVEKFTGDSVNLAKRLEEAAGTGEVVIGEATYRLVREAVRVDRLDALTVKGKAEGIRAYRLLEVAGAPNRPPPPPG